MSTNRTPAEKAAGHICALLGVTKPDAGKAMVMLIEDEMKPLVEAAEEMAEYLDMTVKIENRPPCESKAAELLAKWRKAKEPA